MKKNGEAVKKGYLKRMYKAMFLHTKDVFSDTIKEGVRNAEDLHGVKVKTQKKLDDIMNDIIIANNRAKTNIRANAQEIKEVAQAAWKQAVQVALHEAEEKAGTGEYDDLDLNDFDLDDDDFFKEFDINFDEDDIEFDDDAEPASESYYVIQTKTKTDIDTMVYLFFAELYRLAKLIPDEKLVNDPALEQLVSFLRKLVTKDENEPLSYNQIASTVVDDVDVKEEPTETNRAQAEIIRDNVRTIIKKVDINDMLKKPKVGLEYLEIPENTTDISNLDTATIKDLAAAGAAAKDILKVAELDLITNPEKTAVLHAIWQRIEAVCIAAMSSYEYMRAQDTDSIDDDYMLAKIYYILNNTIKVNSINHFVMFACGLVDDKYIALSERLINAVEAM